MILAAADAIVFYLAAAGAALILVVAVAVMVIDHLTWRRRVGRAAKGRMIGGPR